MHYSVIKNCDIANGPGVRVVLFVSGCTHHCKGCFQPETWDFSYGKPFTQAAIDEILQYLAPDYIAGLTLLGGEPMEQENQDAILDLLQQVKARYPEKTIWCFTGYTLERDLLHGKFGDRPVTQQLLGLLDVLVDGEFIEEKKDLLLRFRGSSNQRLIDMKKTLQTGQTVLWDDGYERNAICSKSK